MPVAERSRLMSRQGVGMITADDARVVATYGHSDELVDVPADGVTMGEIVMRGNTVMKEYFRDPEATAEAFKGGWFHSGDLGVRYPDGYIQLLDRAKDIVISGGENISTVEVEHALDVASRGGRRRRHRHPGRAVGRAAEGVRGAGRRPAPPTRPS